MKATTTFKSHDTCYLPEKLAQAAGEEYAGLSRRAKGTLTQLATIEKNPLAYPVLHRFVTDFLKGEMVWPQVKARTTRAALNRAPTIEDSRKRMIPGRKCSYGPIPSRKATGAEYAHLSRRAKDTLARLATIEKNPAVYPVLHGFVTDFLESEMVWPPVKAPPARVRKAAGG
jgi:hypothetical protein